MANNFTNSFQCDLGRISERLAEIAREPITEAQAATFYALLEDSSIPYVAAEKDASPNRIFLSSFRALHEIGRYCPRDWLRA